METSSELLHHVDDNTLVIGIDEGQFFDHGLIEVVEQLAAAEKQVIVAGLTPTTCAGRSSRSRPCAIGPSTSPRCWLSVTSAAAPACTPSESSSQRSWWSSARRAHMRHGAGCVTTQPSRNSRSSISTVGRFSVSFLVTFASPPDATSSPLRSVSLMSTLVCRPAGKATLGDRPHRRPHGRDLANLFGPGSRCQGMGFPVDPIIDSQRSNTTWLYFARRAHKSSGNPRRRGPSKSTRPSGSRDKR